MAKRRIQWIDFSRGLVVTLIVIGHVIPHGNDILTLIFTFNISFFL